MHMIFEFASISNDLKHEQHVFNDNSFIFIQNYVSKIVATRKKELSEVQFSSVQSEFFNKNSDGHKRYHLKITSKLFEILKFNCLHRTLWKNDERNWFVQTAYKLKNYDKLLFLQ